MSSLYQRNDQRSYQRDYQRDAENLISEGKLLNNRYKVIKSLGQGHFGATFIVTDTALFDKHCVLKQLKPFKSDNHDVSNARRLFRREAETLYTLGSHDQIPTLYAYFEEDYDFYLVEEFVEGKTLDIEEILPSIKKSQIEVISLIKGILEPLAFVHDNQVIHRDIKPSNLIRRQSDQKIVLIDFGAVKQVSNQDVDQEGNVPLTVVIGSSGYMAIEQAEGKPRCASDIYAVGMMAIQALTGEDPSLLVDTSGEVIWRDQVNVSPKFGQYLEKMVRYHYEERFQTAREALEALPRYTSAPNSTSAKRSPDNSTVLDSDFVVIAGPTVLDSDLLTPIGDQTLTPQELALQIANLATHNPAESTQQETDFTLDPEETCAIEDPAFTILPLEDDQDSLLSEPFRDPVSENLDIENLDIENSDIENLDIENSGIENSIFLLNENSFSEDPIPLDESFLEEDIYVPTFLLDEEEDLTRIEILRPEFSPEEMATENLIDQELSTQDPRILAQRIQSESIPEQEAIDDFTFWPDEAETATRIEITESQLLIEEQIVQDPTLITIEEEKQDPGTSEIQTDSVVLVQEPQTVTTPEKSFQDPLWRKLLFWQKLWGGTASVSVTAELKTTIMAHLGGVRGLIFSQDGSIVSAGGDRLLKIWNPNTGELDRTLQGHNSVIYGLGVDRSGQLVASTSNDHTVRVWEISSGQEQHVLHLRSDWSSIVAFSPNPRRIFTTSQNTIKLWNIHHGDLRYSFQGHSDLIHSLALSADEQFLASGSQDKTIRIWSWDKGQLVKVLRGHTGSVQVVLMNKPETNLPEGMKQILVSGSSDQTIKLWDPDQGKEIRTFTGHTQRITALALSPDGNLIASGSADEMIRIWNLTRSKELLCLKGHQNVITALCFSPDGSRLVSSSLDGSLKIWALSFQ